jgi:hypothetical protein
MEVLEGATGKTKKKGTDVAIPTPSRRRRRRPSRLTDEERREERADILLRANAALEGNEWSKASKFLKDASMLYKRISLENDDAFYAVFSEVMDQQQSQRERGNNELQKLVECCDSKDFANLEDTLKVVEENYKQSGDRLKTTSMPALRDRLLGDEALLGRFELHTEKCEFAEGLKCLREATEHYTNYVRSNSRLDVQLLLSLGRGKHEWTQECLRQVLEEEKVRFQVLQQPSKTLSETAAKMATDCSRNVQHHLHEGEFDAARAELQRAELADLWAHIHKFDWLAEVLEGLVDEIEESAIALAKEKKRQKKRQGYNSKREVQALAEMVKDHSQLQTLQTTLAERLVRSRKEENETFDEEHLAGLKSRICRGELAGLRVVFEDEEQLKKWAIHVQQLCRWVDGGGSVAYGTLSFGNPGSRRLSSGEARIPHVLVTSSTAGGLDHPNSLVRLVMECVQKKAREKLYGLGLMIEAVELVETLIMAGAKPSVLVKEGSMAALMTIASVYCKSAEEKMTVWQKAAHDEGADTAMSKRGPLVACVATLEKVLSLVGALLGGPEEDESRALPKLPASTACKHGLVRMIVRVRKSFPPGALPLSATSRASKDGGGPITPATTTASPVVDEPVVAAAEVATKLIQSECHSVIVRLLEDGAASAVLSAAWCKLSLVPLARHACEMLRETCVYYRVHVLHLKPGEWPAQHELTMSAEQKEAMESKEKEQQHELELLIRVLVQSRAVEVAMALLKAHSVDKPKERPKSRKQTGEVIACASEALAAVGELPHVQACMDMLLRLDAASTVASLESKYRTMDGIGKRMSAAMASLDLMEQREANRRAQQEAMDAKKQHAMSPFASPQHAMNPFASPSQDVSAAPGRGARVGF